jgi:CheY-like chemotaxis protein
VPDIPQRVSGDETAVHQVLMNLAMNSAQAMPSGGTLSIGLEHLYVRDSVARSNPGLREGPYVLLKVRDTGVGIDPAQRPRVFEPFFTTKPVGTGTGLGLAMVHAIMHDHQGAVLLESEVGEGTEVRCFFPLLEAETTAADAPPSRRQEGNGERILFVDDEPALAKIGARRLTMLNYRVAEFTDPRQALSHFTQHSEEIDLVVTDFTMPHMTGLDLARTLYQVRPNIRIILLTGFVDDMDERRLEASGIRRVLRKPVTIEELGQAVRETLDER